MTARKAQRRQAVQINATVKEVPSGKPIDWFERIAKVTVIGLGVGSLGTILTFSNSITSSGPLPVPSRAELVKAVDDQSKLNQQITNQLAEQHDITQSVLAQQRQQLSETRSNRLSRLQEMLVGARANVEKDPSKSNRDIVDALQAQLDSLKDEIMRESTK